MVAVSSGLDVCAPSETVIARRKTVRPERRMKTSGRAKHEGHEEHEGILAKRLRGLRVLRVVLVTAAVQLSS
jgi:hypothetical protein